jgi:hypothetical protein
MTPANVALFVIIVFGITAFSLFDFRDLPVKENLKISTTVGLILGFIFYSAAFQTIYEHTTTKDQTEWVTLPTDKATLTSYQSPNKHYKVIKTLDQVTKDDLHWTGKLTVNGKTYTYDDLKIEGNGHEGTNQKPLKISYGTVYRPAKIYGHLFYKGDAKGHVLKLSN